MTGHCKDCGEQGSHECLKRGKPLTAGEVIAANVPYADDWRTKLAAEIDVAIAASHKPVNLDDILHKAMLHVFKNEGGDRLRSAWKRDNTGLIKTILEAAGVNYIEG